MTLSRDSALTVDLQTTRGKINSQFAVTMTAGGSKNSLQGTINGGGAEVKAFTLNGDIALGQLNP